MPNPRTPEEAARITALSNAKDRLASQLLANPAVSLIDIGTDLAQDPPPAPGDPRRLVLRVHLRNAAARQTVPVPAEIDGIPVRTIVADYQLE